MTQNARRHARVLCGRAGVATGGLGLQTWGLSPFHMGIDDSLRRLGGPVSLIESRGMNAVNHRQSSVMSGVLSHGKIIVIFWLHTPLPGTAQQHGEAISVKTTSLCPACCCLAPFMSSFFSPSHFLSGSPSHLALLSSSSLPGPDPNPTTHLYAKRSSRVVVYARQDGTSCLLSHQQVLQLGDDLVWVTVMELPISAFCEIP